MLLWRHRLRKIQAAGCNSYLLARRAKRENPGGPVRAWRAPLALRLAPTPLRQGQVKACLVERGRNALAPLLRNHQSL
jgi:hypothetical protein